MSRTLLAAAVCILASTTLLQAAHAQGTVSSVLGVKKQAPSGVEKKSYSSSLFNDIQLSAAQQDSIDAIHQRYRPLFDQVNKERTTPEIKQSNFLALRVKQRAAMRTVLTAEQQPTFDKNATAQKKADEKLSKALLERIRGE